ncbi:MAG: class I SAM-dependent methyltransferase [Limnochordales bacterium]|nr:class I SAM-dependent methyltransferase [Limnochordales bacterium]
MPARAPEPNRSQAIGGITLRPEFRSPEEKARYVQQVFGTIADRYDLMNLIMTGGIVRYWQAVFRRHTGLRPGQQALDVACGTGELSLIMARQVAPNGRVIGIDFSPAMLSVGREKISRTRYRDIVDLRYGDALKLPFEDDSFDCVATGFALRNMTDLRRALAEMYRVVRPGGRVVSLELSHPVHKWLIGPYRLYVHHVIPLLGRWAARRLDGMPARRRGKTRPAQVSPYVWLPESLSEIPPQQELAEIMRSVGFSAVRYRNLTGGIAALHIGIK